MDDNPTLENPYLTANEVATILAVKAYTVRKWINEGVHGRKLPATRLPGGDIRILLSDVHAFINKRYGDPDA